MRCHTHQAYETVCVERMLAREDIELPAQQEFAADRTFVFGVDRNEPLLQGCDVLLDGCGVTRRLVHVGFQALNVCGITFQRCTYLLLEVVDDHEIRKEWQDVFNLEQVGVLQELHRPVMFLVQAAMSEGHKNLHFDVLLLLHDIFSDL